MMVTINLKSLVGAAVLVMAGGVLSGAAQAQERPIQPAITEVAPTEHHIGGETTNPDVVTVGASVGFGGHAGAGKPGLSLTNTSFANTIVNIDTFSRGPTPRGVTVNGNQKFKLENFMHRPGRGPDLSQFEIDWTRIDFGGAAPLWFGVTLDKALKQAGAFYVGDRTDRTVPSVDTRYNVDAILHLSEGYAAGKAPSGTHYLSGVLALDALNNTLTSDGDLSGTGGSLYIDATVGQDGAFSGKAVHALAGSAQEAFAMLPENSKQFDAVNGEFFGGGSLTSAVAGVVKNDDGFYHAAFGGLAE